MRSAPHTAILILSTIGTLGACGNDAKQRAEYESAKAHYDSAHGGAGNVDGPSLSGRDSARELGPGDMIITDRDSSFDLVLQGDHIATRFSAKTMQKIQRETDTAKASSGFAGSIEKMVKSTVASSLSKELRYPVSDVREARYDDASGRLVIKLKNGRQLFESSKVNNRRVDESFAPDDARRFAAAVNARITGQKR
jgi:hypothetical protein